MELLLPIVLYIFSLFILYLVLKTAVKNGIDSSEAGRILLEKSKTPNMVHTEKKESQQLENTLKTT